MKLKVFVFLLICPFYSFCQCHYFEDFENDEGWTQVGVNCEISNGKFNFLNGAADAEQRRVYRELGLTLDADENWILRLEFNPIDVGSYLGDVFTGHVLVSLTAGTGESFADCPDIPCTGYQVGDQDGIILQYTCLNPSGGILFYRLAAKDGEEVNFSPTIENLELGAMRYIQIVKSNDGNLELSVFSDENFTTHIEGSPVVLEMPNTVENLHIIQHGNVAWGDDDRELWGDIDNVCLTLGEVVGVQEMLENELILFPNPTNKFIEVSHPNRTSKKVNVFDLTGALVRTYQNHNSDIRIDVSDLEMGMYTLFILFDDGSSSRKPFIKN